MHDANGEKLKVPHMGWNQVYQTQNGQAKPQSKPHALWCGIENGARFYYVHSYYVVPEDDRIIAGYSEYPTRFTCAIAQDNLFAVQFHPEDVYKRQIRQRFTRDIWHYCRHLGR